MKRKLKAASNRAVSLPESFGGTLQLFSTRHPAEGSGTLDMKTLQGNCEKAQRIDLTSAYYDSSFCLRILEKRTLRPKLKSLRIVFNGLGGSRLDAQRADLLDLQRKLRGRADEVEVRLCFESGIFHSKLFLIRQAKTTTAFVGSANATMAALNLNEEILVRISGSVMPLESYFNKQWERASPVDEVDERRLSARSLVAFFRMGSLFFKPVAPLTLTFNPFSALLAALPESEREKMTDIPIPYAEAAGSIGAFSVKKAIDFKSDAEEEQSRAKVGIRPYAIETCFGYWVPQALRVELDVKLEAVASGKRQRFESLMETLDSFSTRKLERRFKKYMDSCLASLGERKVDWRSYISDDSGPAFAKFLQRLVENLKEEKYIKRLSVPFIDGAMPEIWDDPVAYLDFRNSFFEYLEYVSNLSGNQSRAPKEILERIGCHGPTPASEIETSLEKYLSEVGWRRDEWELRKS